MTNFSFNPLQMALKPLFDKAKAEDSLFAIQVQQKESRTDKPKSFAECCEYILGEAYKYANEHRQGSFGMAGMPDDDMIGLIKHYYDEDDIKVEKVVDAKPVVSATPTTTTKPTKVVRPKETLGVLNVPMVRPKDSKEARRESRKQADNVIVMDMFAGMWDDDEKKEEKAEEVVDDLPM